ncbi:MAG: chromate efflux transporter [Paenibacillus sp.]|uniref:chromate efflux transporter n=1 Tax=Paenibacillus sp. TaxID=58172 RepID=UPI002913C597|nr:chromate efflux transporter [Paenibacillus sp.]MDU4697297.1 chromate efflux transporter [Paenibacillus sp.]
MEQPNPGRLRRIFEIFTVSTKLGLTSFGGPIAHLGYFHEEYVNKRKWVGEQKYAELVALCQFLPGPASSQVGMGIGLYRGGIAGALAAWAGFTLPSAVALVLFALLLQGTALADSGWLHGLKLTAVAIVAQAVWSMGVKLAAGRSRATIAALAAAATLLWPSGLTQVLIIAASALTGLWLYRSSPAPGTSPAHPGEEPQSGIRLRRSWAVASLAAFVGLLGLLPLVSRWWPNLGLQLLDVFYRAGALVFGGGHVVLPLLQSEVVPRGWIGEADFLSGYGAAQAVPGPLFTFASYLGASIHGVTGAILATIAIFLPAFLLVVGVLPFWHRLRKIPKVQYALQGVNAAVVGILLAALYDPIWVSSIQETGDFIVAMLLFVMLVFWKLPPWAVVVAGAAGGAFLGWIGSIG